MVPARTAWEYKMALLISLVRIPAANPYSVAFDLSIASSKVLNFIICMTGPKISSLAIRMLSVTFEKTVGWTKYPLLPCREPPHSNLAPSFFPASISSRILLNCSSSILMVKSLLSIMKNYRSIQKLNVVKMRIKTLQIWNVFS